MDMDFAVAVSLAAHLVSRASRDDLTISAR
jgi:hypothetical protein